MAYERCIQRLAEAAGRPLTDREVEAIYARLHRAALDIKAGRVSPSEVGLGKKLGEQLGVAGGQDPLLQAAAERAATELQAEADLRERQAHLQLVKLGARQADVETMRAAGVKSLEAVKSTMARDFSGRTNVSSIEERTTGWQDYFRSKLLPAWEALGHDFLGFFQDRSKLIDLIRELRGEDTGNALAKAGAKAFHDAAEEARRVFNSMGGDIGRLDDWGMPQHHSQEKVALAGEEAWVNAVLPKLDRARYVDELGQAWPDAELRSFLSSAWRTIATDGHANREPGKFIGAGKRANRHAESRQIHFKDADSVIGYWDAFGEKTAVEILSGHIDTMAKDIAFIEQFGPNPNLTYATLRDAALQSAIDADKPKTKQLEAEAKRLDSFFDYVAGRSTTTHNMTLKKVADGIAHLNTAGKLGGAALASLFGDKPMMEAVSHLNDLPMLSRWRTETALLNPVNEGDRRLLQRQGLMLDSVRSGLQRFYEGLGQSSTTGRIANAVMRITGMQAINDIRKGAFGLSLMSAIGNEIRSGRGFADLHDSDVRTLRSYGIAKADWETWRLASLERVAGADHVLTPESISRIPDETLREAGVIGADDGSQAAAAAAARRGAIVKLLGAVNSESEFAIVTPGWRERATFYAGVASNRGTAMGEILRSVLQFKSFPWAMFQRGMDAVANADGPTSKAVMSAYLITSTTLAGAMLMQTRDMLTGKDPRKMTGDPKDLLKFWGAAFLQGGALGIYGDFLYGINQTRYGSGPFEAAAGPTLGPLVELGLVQPLNAAKAFSEGKPTHLGAQTLQDLKGFVPGGNIWYAKAALDHLIWQKVFEQLSPGYLATIRNRTMRDYQQDWWWRPGESTPERAPAISQAFR